MADFSNALSDFFAAHGAYCRCAKRSVSEMENTAFWCGIGAGMVLGAAVGMAVSPAKIHEDLRGPHHAAHG